MKPKLFFDAVAVTLSHFDSSHSTYTEHNFVAYVEESATMIDYCEEDINILHYCEHVIH